MEKQVLFYFVHAHGNGHKATFNMLYPQLSVHFKTVAITTNKEVTEYLTLNHKVDVVELPPKYPENYKIPEHTFSKPFEVTPYAIEPAQRAKALAEAIILYQPKVLYCDGVPELAIMARSMGVPVVLVHLPGNIMNDPTQIFAHQLADHIVAHFPFFLEQEHYEYKSKTFYSGYLSKYSGDNAEQPTGSEEDQVTILLGYENYDQTILKNITADSTTKFVIIGNKQSYDLGSNCQQLGTVKNINKAIGGKRVITAVGQNTIAELLSLNKQLVLLPEPRPYDEQNVHAKVLAEKGLALLAHDDLSPAQWQKLLAEAKLLISTNKNLVNHFAAKEIAHKMKNWYA